jgi:tetratricopeptide (TPR) repeat protein
MKWTLSGALLVVALASWLQGCGTVVSVRPLYTDDELVHPVLEPRIVGEWIVADVYPFGNSDGSQQLGRSDATIASSSAEGLYTVEFRRPVKDSKRGQESYSYDIRFVSLGGRLYFDAEFSELQKDNFSFKQEEMNVLAATPAHFLGRLSVEKDFLRVEGVNPDWLEKNVPENSWQKTSMDRYTDVTTLLHSTAELREVISKNAESGAFFPIAYFCRPGKDCEALAMEDVLHLWPDENESLQNVAGFYESRKDYRRALELEGQLLRVEPKSYGNLLKFGEIQLHLRDFTSARRSFEEARKAAESSQKGESTRAAELFEWTCFLEGKYSDVLSTGAKFNLGSGNLSAESILLNYFSLLRLGRKDEAEAYLNEKSLGFKGTLEDHALLLRAQDRTGHPYIPEAKNEQERRTMYFGALSAAHNKHSWYYTSFLQAAINNAPGDSLMALAAQIEFEQTSPKGSK